MIEQYEVVWKGLKTGEGVWGVVEVDRSRGIIYILLNGQNVEDVADGRPISTLDKGGVVRATDRNICLQNSCELIRKTVRNSLGSDDYRLVLGL